MSENLLPCPFCGGKALITRFEQGIDAYYVVCGNPKCLAGIGFELPEAEAIAAWNTRTERTCKPQGEWERVSQTQEIRHIYCECGEYFGADERDSFPFAIETKAYLPNYCQNCGAKVIE